MRLIRNLDVAAGHVNSATGTVVNVIYNNAECDDLMAGKHPSGFRGFVTKKGRRIYPLPNKPHWVPIYRQKFVAARSDLPTWIIENRI